MRTLLFGILLLMTFSASAQSDYVVTTKGDTIRGDIKILTFDLMDRVQITVDKKRTTYTALQVRTLMFKKEIYHTQKFENSIRFMKLIKPGYLGYYAFRQTGQVTYDGRFLVKRDGRGMEVPNIGFKKAMAAFLSDCEGISTKIKDDVYKRTELEKLIDDYNHCAETNSTGQQSAVAQTPPPAVGNEKTDAIKALQTKIAALSDFTEKKDVTDLLNDISDKVIRQQTIPNYQLEALKGMLSGKEEVKSELDKIVTLLKGN